MSVNRFILLLVFHVISMGLLAQSDGYLERFNVSTLDMRNGLPSNNVNTIFADSEGFVWLSTYGGGIVRYDGYGFSSFYTGAQGLQWRSHSSKKVCEDRFRRLWVVFDEYTQVIDMRTMTVTRVNSKDNRLDEILSQRGVNVMLDSEGKLWLVTMSHIHCLRFHEDGSVKNILSYQYSSNTPTIAIADLDGNGKVWACIDDGVYRLTAEGEKIVKGEISPQLSQIGGLFITSLLRQGDNVWMGSNHGLRRFNPHEPQLSSFTHTADPGSLSHEFVSCMELVSDTVLIAGTLGGIDILYPNQQHFEHWNTSTTPWLMSSNFVSCLHYNNESLWIGTETGGVACLSANKLAIRNYKHGSDPSSLSPNAVNAMLVQKDGTLWVGTVEGGLNRMNADGGFTHFTTGNSALSHNSVSALADDGQGRLWIGTWGGGVNYIDTATGNIGRLSVDAPHIPLLNFVGALAYDAINKGLWIGSNDGIFFYNLESEALEEPFEECRFARGCIGSIIDNDRQLWIGCLEGAFLIDIGKGKDKNGRFSFQHLRDKLDNPSSGIIDKITCFYQSSDGTLWIGSNGYGLYKRVTGNDGKDKFVAYTTNDGLANNAVKGIVEDNVGKLWIATGNGLSVLNPQTGAFTTLGEADGLLCQQFYWNGATRGKEGTLWFGCQGGLVRLESGKMAQVKAPQLHLTHLTIDNQDAVAGDGHIDEDICYAEEVRLHESNKSLVFDFSALNYGHETQGVYSYRMKGLEEEWAQLAPGQHSVRYTSLPSGDYVFEVRYASALSNAESTVSVKVSVSPYFYKSWWFITLLLLALLAAAVAFYKNRVRQLRRQEEEKLMQPIEEALRESEDPVALQKRIQGIIDNRNRMTASVNKTAVADDQQAALSQIPFMDRVMELMEQNYMNSEYGVTELSEQMGVNRTLLSKKLNEETGMSPGQFIRHYRLDMARKLLERNTANRNIAEIAFSVGFNDPKYFTRCFTKEFGVSPSSFGKN